MLVKMGWKKRCPHSMNLYIHSMGQDMLKLRSMLVEMGWKKQCLHSMNLDMLKPLEGMLVKMSWKKLCPHSMDLDMLMPKGMLAKVGWAAMHFQAVKGSVLMTQS